MDREASWREDPTVYGQSLAPHSTIADCPGPIAGSSQVALVVGRPWGRLDLREAGPDPMAAVAGSPVAGSLGLGVDTLDLGVGSFVPVVGIADVVAVEDSHQLEVHLGYRMNQTPHDHREMHRQAHREMSLRYLRQ
jgi:hypothetical protein